MQFEHPKYSLEQYSLYELYPFNSKNKRYFKAYHPQQQDSLLAIVYPIQLVNAPLLIRHFEKLININHPLLGSIKRIIESTHLNTQATQPSKEEVIAIIIHSTQDSTFYHYFQTLISIGPFNEKIALSFILSLIQLIQFMNDKGFIHSFNSQYLYFDTTNCRIRIDGYGDWKYFKISEGTMGDLGQLGKVLFTFFNKHPPYCKMAINDKFYSMIQKKNFDKFWELSQRNHLTPKNIIKLINQLWNENTQLNSIKKNEFLRQYRILTQEQLKEQVKMLIENKKNAQQQLQKKKSEARQKYQLAIQNRKKAHRGGQNQTVSLLIQKINIEENSPRNIQMANFSQSINAIIAHSKNPNFIFAMILTILEQNKSNPRISIQDIADNRSYINFHMEGQTDEGYQIQTNVKIEVLQSKQCYFLKIDCYNGNYIQKIWSLNYLKKLFHFI